MSFEILTNLSVSILVTCSSHYLLLLSTHSLIGRILQNSLICWLLILFIFVLPTIDLSTFISFASNIYLVLDVSALVSSAYIIVERMVALYIFDLVSFFIYLFLQRRSFKVSQSCCFLRLGFKLFY